MVKFQNKLLLRPIITQIEAKFGNSSCNSFWDIGVHTDGYKSKFVFYQKPYVQCIQFIWSVMFWPLACHLELRRKLMPHGSYVATTISPHQDLRPFTKASVNRCELCRLFWARLEFQLVNRARYNEMSLFLCSLYRTFLCNLL